MTSSSAWKIFRARGLCLMRQLRPVTRANPVLAISAVIVLVGLFGGLVWASVRNAAALVAATSINDGIVVAIVAMSSAVFAAVALTVQHMSAAGESLDAQVRSAPLTRLELFLGTVGLPTTIFCLVLLVCSLTVFAPLIYGAGAPWYALCSLLFLETGVFYAAGVAGEVLARITHRHFRVLFALSPIVAAWAGASALAGNTSWLGIIRPVGRSVVNLEVGSAPRLFTGTLLFLLVSVTDWVVVAAVLRPPGRQTSSRVGHWLRFPRSRTGIVALATLKRLGRERKLQRHMALVCATAGAFSVSVAILLPEAVMLAAYGGTLLAALGVAVVPLTTPGISQDSEWFWRSTPLTTLSYVTGMFIAGLGGGVVALLAPELAALSPLLWFTGGLSASDAARIILPAVPVILLLAVSAGFFVPCRLHNTYERVLSFAVLGALVAGVFATASWASPQIAALGVPGPFAGLAFVLAVAVLSLTVALLTENARRRS
ncbi:MAG: hypothetical protein M3317_15185 [Actinomycetota bacterium]|nr:hypothetical protein [Actinomycetota bacterium]